MTQEMSLTGSAQKVVPVAPLCPNAAEETSVPKSVHRECQEESAHSSYRKKAVMSLQFQSTLPARPNPIPHGLRTR